MTYKILNMRYMAAVAFVIFCLLCAIVAISMLPEDRTDHQHRMNPYQEVVKKSRMVQSLLGRPYHYSDWHQVDDTESLRLKLHQILGPSPDLEQGDEYEDIIADEYNEDEEDEDLLENDVFEEGDFDYDSRNSSKPSTFMLSVIRIGNRIESNVRIRNAQQMFRIKLVETLGVAARYPNSTEGSKLRNVGMVNFEGVPVVEDNVYWSTDLEESTPKGVSDSDVGKTLNKLRGLPVQRVQQPTWNVCGRPKNLFEDGFEGGSKMVFEDGSKACGRYRAPHQYLVQGEVLSFYLARLLSITNVPVVALVSSNVQHERWSRTDVRNEVLKTEWQPNTTVALIQWIDDLERDKMPLLLLSALLNETTIHAHTSSLFDLSVEQLVELLQWSDLIIFDYLTGNYDRVASMQDAADKEKKPSILSDTIHNLVRSRSTRSLWLIDNESGLLDGYSLLYGRLGKDGRFLNFHRRLLQSICLFRRTTADRIQRLHRTGDPAKILLEFVHENEPLFPTLEEGDLLSKRLRERIKEVHDHIEKCRRSFG